MAAKIFICSRVMHEKRPSKVWSHAEYAEYTERNAPERTRDLIIANLCVPCALCVIIPSFI
jgi:hypothetical protein